MRIDERQKANMQEKWQISFLCLSLAILISLVLSIKAFSLDPVEAVAVDDNEFSMDAANRINAFHEEEEGLLVNGLVVRRATAMADYTSKTKDEKDQDEDIRQQMRRAIDEDGNGNEKGEENLNLQENEPRMISKLRSSTSSLLTATSEIVGMDSGLRAQLIDEMNTSTALPALFEEQVAIAGKLEKERKAFREALKKRSSTEAEAANFDRMSTKELSDLYYFTCFAQSCNDINDCQSFGCPGACRYNAQMGYNSCQGGNRSGGVCGSPCGNYYTTSNRCSGACPFCVNGICSPDRGGFAGSCGSGCVHSAGCSFNVGCGRCVGGVCTPGIPRGGTFRNSCQNPCNSELDCTDGPCYACTMRLCS